MPPQPSEPFPTFSEIRNRTLQVFKKRPCLLQIKVCDALLRRDKNVVCSAATGFGKTLTFLMPLLFNTDGILIIVTALNILGQHNVGLLKSAGISAVEVNATTRKENPNLFSEIKANKYRVAVVNPELLMEDGGEFEKLLDTKEFTSKLMGIVFDEGHCISRWGSFRSEYRDVGQLFYRLHGKKIPFYVTSATLSTEVLADVCRILHLDKTNTTFFHKSNDRPNVFLGVRKMEHAANSFEDLSFLIPKGWKEGDPIPPRFLIFFDDCKEAEKAAKYLRNLLPVEWQDKIPWFHSIMTDKFREDAVRDIAAGVIWGITCTDAFGLGVDIPDIELVIQWRVPANIDTLQQRFGRGARAPELEAFALLIAEPSFFEEEEQLRAAAREKRNASKRKKPGGSEHGPAGGQRNSKRRRTTNNIASTSSPAEDNERVPFAPLPTNSSIQDVGVQQNTTTTTSSMSALDLRGDQDQFLAPHAPTDTLLEPVVADTELAGTVSIEDDNMDLDEPEVDEPEVATASAEQSSTNKTSTLANSKRKALRRKLGDDPVMDQFVNAEYRKLPCRREIIRKFFLLRGVKLVADHMECDPSSPTGCSRCKPRPSRICCDICNNTEFTQYFSTRFPHTTADLEIMNTGPKPKARSQIKKYDAEFSDVQLKNALLDWRDERAETELKEAEFIDLGPGLFMPTKIVDRIVDCAHYHKIRTNEDLIRETQWPESMITKYGSEIIGKIEIHRPLPTVTAPFSTEPLILAPSATSAGNSRQEGQKQRRVQRCSACKQSGHNAKNKLCPAKRTCGLPLPNGELYNGGASVHDRADNQPRSAEKENHFA